MTSLALAPGYEYETEIDGGVTRGYWETGRLKYAITPAMVNTMEMTIANLGRLMNIREKVFICSIDLRMESFMAPP
jgi:hypothetical protein